MAILDFLYTVNGFLGNDYFLFSALTISFCVKIYLLTQLTRYSEKFNLVGLFLTMTLIGTTIEDFSWLARLGEKLFYPSLDYRIRIFIIRCAWAFSVMQWQSLALFLESLIQDKFKLSIQQMIFISITSFFSLSFLYFAIFRAHNTFSAADRPNFEFLLLYKEPIYTTILIFITSIFVVINLKYKKQLPKILRTQVKTILVYLILPKVVADFMQLYPFNILTPNFVTSNFSVIGFSTLMGTYTIYYCMKKILQLRFLNLTSKVQSQEKNNRAEIFKEPLDQLSQATEYKELTHITKTFFKNTFDIPSGRTRLHIDQIEQSDLDFECDKLRSELANNFLNDKDIIEYLRLHKILIYDELEFSNFYEKDYVRDASIKFMERLNCEIFIPVFNKKNLVAYIAIEAEPKRTALYNSTTQAEIFIFASYLGNVINLLQKRNLNSLMLNEKEMKEEIFQKHQEINQYKESIVSFLKDTKQNKIGIIFYKNKRFSFGNQHAKEIISFNINISEGYKLSRDLRKVAENVVDYKAPQIFQSQDPEGKAIIISALPNLEYNNVILMVYYPDIADLIKPQLEQMKDPSKWDYLLYLETTKIGKLINQLIPSNSETLLEFKIKMLQTALSKKATFLEMHNEDLLPAVELLHHISLRENLHILKLKTPSQNYDTAIQLFGINNIFSDSKEEPLLQKLNGSSTLFIQNIHFMDIETQKYLAEFIRYGYYRVFKSEQKMTSNVRIICSSNQDLKRLISEGKFSEALFSELNKTSLIMPPLLGLTDEELKNLISGYTTQTVKSTDIFSSLSDKDLNKIISTKPSSLNELKIKVQNILSAKSKNNVVYQEAQLDPEFNVSDPQLIEAARLGKHALRDPKILALLWNKFKNQNKIATFLGVNRSSVNRRCREYDFE